MSNSALGNVYSLIMNDVIESCRTTFEEDGVNQQTLDDLRSTWQRRLTSTRVGSFPWDPAPAPQPMPMPMPNPTVPSNGSGTPQNTGPSTPDAGPGQVRIKQEPDSQAIQTNGLPANYRASNVASQQAAQNLKQKFGSDAQLQIDRLQAQSGLNAPAGRGAPSGQYPASGPVSEQQRASVAEYHRRQAQANAARMQVPGQQQQPPVANNARTDGADDWDSFVSDRRQAVAASGSPEVIDMTIRDRLEQMQREQEGGGLLIPVSEQPNHTPKPRLPKSKSARGLPQVDGIDDDEEESKADVKDDLFDEGDDVDAINSDLDDPDDNVLEEEQDEGRPNQIMLCTYDKVQRVKNKWKCTLKDGVLNSGGKDYVFTKATGEFEW